jgi:uncharacterized protein (DUF58 family)
VDRIVPAGSPPLASALQNVRAGWRVVIVSDFLGDEEALLARAATLDIEGVEVFAIHVVADEEVDPPLASRLATDPENPGFHRVLNAGVGEEYAAAFTAWRYELATRWRTIGAEFTEVRTGEDTAAAIRRTVRLP